MVDRQLIPPFSALIVFEAAVRCGSFTRAAEACGLTQGAVSHQIKNLEDALGTKLFVKDGRKVRATEAAKSYHAEIQQALARIASATRSIVAHEGSQAVRLGVLPTFSSQWLIPRLSSFLSESPEIPVRMTIKPHPFEFSDESLDAAIHVGAADWPGLKLDLLFQERAAVVASPELLRKYPIGSARDFMAAPLILGGNKQTEWPHVFGWNEFFRSHHIQYQPHNALQLDTYGSIGNSAAAGQGFAIIPIIHIRRELGSGSLVVAFGDHFLTGRAYYFAYPADRMNYASFRKFRSWLLAQASVTRTDFEKAVAWTGSGGPAGRQPDVETAR